MRATIAGLLLLLPLQGFGQSAEAVDYYNQGVKENSVGHLVNATVHFSKAIALYPQYSEAYYERGRAFSVMGEHQQAVEDFEAAIEHGAKTVGPYLELVSYYDDRGKYTEVLAVLDRILVDMPEQALGATYDKAKIYRKMNKPDLQLAALRDALKLTEPGDDFNVVLHEEIKKLTGE